MEKPNRRDFLGMTAAALGSLAAGGCVYINNKREVFITSNPEQPMVNELTVFGGEYWQTAEISVAGGAPVATIGLGSQYTPASAGRFIISLFAEEKTTGEVYVAPNGGRLMTSSSKKRRTISQEFIVRHNNKFDRLEDRLPADVAPISAADWQTYVLPKLLPQTVTEITSLEASLQTWETLVSRGVAPNGFWYDVDITSPTQLPGFTDTTGSGNRDYAGRASLTPAALTDILGQAHDIQTPQQAWFTILQENPTDKTNTFTSSYIPFPNSGGNINCDLIFSYRVNNKPVVMGVCYDHLPVSADQGIFNKVQAARATAYDSRSVLVIPTGTKIDIRKAMDAEKAYHVANNP